MSLHRDYLLTLDLMAHLVQNAEIAKVFEGVFGIASKKLQASADNCLRNSEEANATAAADEFSPLVVTPAVERILSRAEQLSFLGSIDEGSSGLIQPKYIMCALLEDGDSCQEAFASTGVLASVGLDSKFNPIRSQRLLDAIAEL